ncbi:MAG TPA: hypothetical protein VOA64_13140 [Candidatus Dormibacteraeota bacterium]|nr:hypothetical protein [Candidatus Dormibacteraeota bacterium]
MKPQTFSSSRLLIATLFALLVLADTAQAGPPLICHSIEIGDAKSLPWTSHDWNLSGNETYDLANLVPDTLAILNPATPVLVRMETLRRATLYARQDPRAAKELLTKLHSRAINSETAQKSDALAWFDAGYLTESYKAWIGKGESNPAAGLDGYAWVTKAISLRGSDPEMEFAAALISLQGPQTPNRHHVQKAIAGAKNDPLLARNLASRFSGNHGETIAELLARSTL